MRHALTVIITALTTLILSSSALSDNRMITFDPVDTVYHLEMDFPFYTKAEIMGDPVVGDTTRIMLELIAIRDVEKSRTFTVSIRPDDYASTPVDSVVWSGIRKDERFWIYIPVVFELGGNYQITVQQMNLIGKPHALYSLVATFGPSGDLIYFGKPRSPVARCTGLFMTANRDTFHIVKLNQYDDLRKIQGIPFDIELDIYPTPKVGEWSTVDYVVRTNRRFMQNVQFEWAYYPTLKLQGYPGSQEIRPELDEVFEGSFQFKPRYFGFSFLEFSIFAEDVRAESGRSESSITFYMAFDSTETLRYLGTENICECEVDEDDPLYSHYKPVLHFKGFTLRPKIYRSKPDFEAIALEEALKDDTTAVDQATVDSVLNELRRK